MRRPAVAVDALQSSPAASQASSREFKHVRFPWDVIGLQALMYSISQWEILGGRRGGATKPMKLSFSINALSPFHASMFNLGLHYKCLSSQSSWSWWTSGSVYVANTIQALSTYMVLLEQLC